ncbi:MAG: flagellar FlbD family protein [Lachnospiraceae bacterium]|nr:flagellar FlbD family protein [Lachnospiraceae bacterium]
MIEITRLNGKELIINAELIETVEETPDTVITLTNGKKLIVKESRQEVKNLVISYKRDIFKILNEKD